MTVAEIIGLAVALVIMGIALIGSVLPIIPGTGLVFLAALVHRLCFGSAGPGNWTLLFLALLFGLSMLLDHIASAYGARRLGATWRGLTGAVLGGLVGLFFNLPGVILGPFLGAFLFEWMGGRKPREAGKAGFGAMLGLVLGVAGKFACCVVMIGLFTVSVLERSFEASKAASPATRSETLVLNVTPSTVDPSSLTNETSLSTNVVESVPR